MYTIDETIENNKKVNINLEQKISFRIPTDPSLCTRRIMSYNNIPDIKEKCDELQIGDEVIIMQFGEEERLSTNRASSIDLQPLINTIKMEAMLAFRHTLCYFSC